MPETTTIYDQSPLNHTEAITIQDPENSNFDMRPYNEYINKVVALE